MKQDFYEVHKPEVPFEVQEREIPSIMNRPQPYHWVWMTLLYLPGMLLHFTTYLYIMFGILFVDVFLCLGYHYISSLYEYVRGLSARVQWNASVSAMSGGLAATCGQLRFAGPQGRKYDGSYRSSF